MVSRLDTNAHDRDRECCEPTWLDRTHHGIVTDTSSLPEYPPLGGLKFLVIQRALLMQRS
jgi:hypothetical protein